MDDRILLVPPPWAADSAVFESLPANATLSRRLREFLPLDFARMPQLRGESRTGEGWEIPVQALMRQIKPQHHVVDLAGGVEALLFALNSCPAQSITLTGFFPTPATMSARGQQRLATGMDALYNVLRTPAQMLRPGSTGVDESALEAIIKQAEATLDRRALAEVADSLRQKSFVGLIKLDIPALYLSLAMPVPGADEMFDVVQSYIPGARADALSNWGLRLQDEDGAHELADKVIPFIEGVIAARNAG